MNIFRLYELREKNNLTQKDIANILNVKQQTYSIWEKEDKIIPLKHLITLCNYYETNLNYISNLSKTNKRELKNTELNKVEIGKRLKQIIKSNNLKQYELAKILNTTPSTISSYVNGKNLILTAFAYQICKDFKISFDWLIFGEI